MSSTQIDLYEALLFCGDDGHDLLTVYAAGLANQLRYSWQVLKNYGYMSSATALFVLKEALADKARGRFLLAAFGPGFSGYFIVLEL